PPLKGRDGDPALLAHHFLNPLSQELNPNIRGFTPDALAAPTTHAWPGKVRELENRRERAGITAETHLITAAAPDLPKDAEPVILNLKQAREEADRKALTNALATADGNISQAAKLLGISRPTFYDLLKQHNMQI